MVYIGVDLHRKVSQVAAVQTNSQVLWNRRIRSRPEEFAEIFGELPASPVGVAFEATCGWGWFADLLADLGVPAHMSHPKGTKGFFKADPRIRRLRAIPGIGFYTAAVVLAEVWDVQRFPPLFMGGLDADGTIQRGSYPTGSHQQARFSPLALGAGRSRRRRPSS